MTHDVFTGVIVSLAPSGAIIRVDEPLDLLSNLKIMLPSSQTPQEIVGDLYAKVVSHGGAENHYTIRFTAVPERVAEALRALT